ncbi:PREDICTED: transmembrane protein 161A [Nanorana parkeri]|uniref:transmembrane protein 161A n=1 Tax=Nanorana parkeri TaxID=125878 RepID=UPI00085477E4|nr:PREDICTED: transmembrane protein 161A [Nanorana parkeri]
MAVMGIQMVVSLLAASIMHRVSPHYSFARWILCNGSLFRYKHPTEDELRALAGKQKPKARRERRVNGMTDEKPLTVPRDIDLHLDTQQITAIDSLVLRYFLEYQWFIDFALYSTIIYLFTEGYYCLVDAQNELNIGILWCLITVMFSIKVLLTMMKHYFRSEEGGERSVCLTFAFFFVLIAMIVMIVREEYLEFGLESGLNSICHNLELLMKQRGWQVSIPFIILAFKIALVALCSFLGACLTFPGLRLAQTHLDALKMAADRPMLQYMSDSTYNTFRLWIIVVLCLLRLSLTRYHLQAYLEVADTWVEQMKREAGRISMLEIQRKISRIFCYLTVIALQYLAPIILTLHCILLMKTMGGYSWGLYPEETGFTPVVGSSPAPSTVSSEEEEEDTEDVQMAVEHIIGALSAFRDIFPSIFFRGLFSFLTWWVSVCQIVTSLFGLYFHQYLGGSS